MSEKARKRISGSPPHPLTPSPVYWLLLLLLFFAQATTAARETSLTSDEGPQLTSGYSFLVTGDMHLIEFDGHPPFAKVLNALPLLLIPDLGSPATVPSWTSDDPISLVWVTQEFLYPYRPLDRVVTAARLPAALWGVLLGACLYRWARDVFGARGGVLALFLLAFDPNLLAHAGLATNDMPMTAACFIALFTFWRTLRRPTGPRLLLAGVTLGLAQSTKLSALLLLPVEGLWLLVWMVREWRMANSEWRMANQRISPSPPPPLSPSPVYLPLHFALILLIAALTLWATYGFGPVNAHWRLFNRVTHATGGGHPAFLMGEISTQGWWYYFPVAFAIKTPLPTLILLLAAAAQSMWQIANRKSQIGGAAERQICESPPHPSTVYRLPSTDYLSLLLFPALYAVATIVSHLNIGYRHLLPVLPFLYVFASQIANSKWQMADQRISGSASWRSSGSPISDFQFPNPQSPIPKYALRFTFYALLLWLVSGALAIWPFHLTFFNEVVGGADQGYHYLVDSNTDWGQAHKALQQYMEQEGIASVKLSTYIEFGAALDGYGLTFEPLAPLHAAPGVLPSRFNPAPGVYALSSTTLQGIFTAEPEMYDWFRQRGPDALVGHALLIYRVPERFPGQWVAQCTQPVTPLSPEVIAEGFGAADLTRLYFDCTQSWLLPQGQTPGWYVLSRETATGDDAFIRANLAAARQSYVQTRSTFEPPFVIYENGAALAPTQPATVRLGDLTFLGHTVYRPADVATVEVWTFWRVETQPARPLSLMLHLGLPGGSIIAGDGLGVPQEQWRSGDVLIQRHRLGLPPDAPAGDYTLYTGAYWRDVQPPERWPVSVGQKITGDHIPLPPVTISHPQ